MTGKRSRVGDLIEISVGDCFAYAQVTHIHNKPPKYGHLLRVFEGLNKVRLSDLNAICIQPVQFQTFFAVNSALNKGIVSIVANASIPKPWDEFPVFRVMGLVDPITKKAESWGLWDGIESLRIGRSLTAVEKKLPILGIVNDTMLIEYIQSGWVHEKDIHT